MRNILASALVAATILSSPAMAEAEDAEQTEAEKPDRVTYVHAGQLLAEPGQSVLSNKTIIVRNDRIESIADGFVSPPQDNEDDNHVIDMKDRFVLPGLMDMHVHLSFQYDANDFKLRGVADEIAGLDKNQKDDVSGMINAIGYANKTLMAGYTTVRNVGSFGWHIPALKQAINAGRIDGPRILTAMHTLHPGSGDDPGACSGVEGCRRAVRRQIDMGADLIKIYATCSGSKPCGQKDAPGIFLDDELDAIIATARSRQMRVAAHGHASDGILRSVKAGADSIEHGSFMPQEARDILKRNGGFLVPTTAVVENNVRAGLKKAQGPMRTVMQGFIDGHAKNFMAAYRAGVKIAAGSDAGVTKHGKNADELVFYVKAGMPASDAIKSATVHAADLIDKSKDLGTLEVGKLADIISVEGNPLTDISTLQSVKFVMKNGEVFKCEETRCP
ncbi:MAG: amidohydrolase family protein [Parasphingorhabdus sp.]